MKHTVSVTACDSSCFRGFEYISPLLNMFACFSPEEIRFSESIGFQETVVCRSIGTSSNWVDSLSNDISTKIYHIEDATWFTRSFQSIKRIL